MKLVAPIARATNIDLETTTAAMSKLADAGLSGSLAGTALRNLFSNMADPTSKLAKSLGFTVESSEDLIKAFKQLKKDGVGLAEAVQMVDVRARPAFFTLLNQIESVERLSLEYRILDGEANNIAETMRDSLSNDIEIANSAFDALRRNIVEQFTPAMRQGIQFTTDLAEALRFLVKDLADFTSRTKEAGVASMIFFGTANEGNKSLLSLLGDLIKSSNALNRMEESLDSTNLSLGRASEGFSTVRDNLEALEGVKALSDSIKKGILDEKAYQNIIQYQKVLGSEFDVIFDAINRGTIDYREATVLVQSQLEKNLKSVKSTYEQEEQNLALINKQIEAKEKLETDEVLADADNPINSELFALRKRRDLIFEFLNDTSKEYKLLKDIFKETISAGGDLDDKLDTKAKKVSDLVSLEIELRKQQELTRIEALKVDVKENQSTEFRFKTAKELHQAKLNLINLELEAELRKIDLTEDGEEQSAIKRLIAQEKYYQKLAQLREAARKDFIKAEEAVAKEADKRGESSLKNSIKGFEEENRAKADALKTQLEDIEKFNSRVAEMTQIAAQGLQKLSTEFFNNQQLKRENELMAIDNWEQERIKLAGDNAEAIKAIEEEAERKRKEVRIKQAKSDKLEALFQIALNTAVGITSALGDPFKIALVAALGAAQAAVVAARPLPQFYKGTDNSPEGLAVVGDRYGRELIKDGKTGEYRLTPNKATVQYLSEGSKVFTNKETERILASVDHNGIAVEKLNNGARVNEAPVVDYDKLGDRFERAVTKIPVSTTNFDERGVRTFVTKGRSRTERLNNRYKY